MSGNLLCVFACLCIRNVSIAKNVFAALWMRAQKGWMVCACVSDTYDFPIEFNDTVLCNGLNCL